MCVTAVCQRQVSAIYWDGKTNYAVKLSDAEEAKRIKEFGDWLEEGSSDEEATEA